MVKPEIVERSLQGQIVDILARNRFKIIKMKQFRFDGERAGRFYAVHEGKPFFEGLIEYITSGPVVGLALQRENAVPLLRELVGATDPEKARLGTIRYMYGTDLQHNAVHASDSPESAEKELAIVFPED